MLKIFRMLKFFSLIKKDSLSLERIRQILQNQSFCKFDIISFEIRELNTRYKLRIIKAKLV